MKSYQELFAELKRRKVFKVAGVYGVVAFALIQVADPLVTALNLPADFLTYIVVLLLLGFPVAIVLAWAFEVTPEMKDYLRRVNLEGVRAQRTAKPEAEATP